MYFSVHTCIRPIYPVYSFHTLISNFHLTIQLGSLFLIPPIKLKYSRAIRKGEFELIKDTKHSNGRTLKGI